MEEEDNIYICDHYKTSCSLKFEPLPSFPVFNPVLSIRAGPCVLKKLLTAFPYTYIGIVDSTSAAWIPAMV